MLKNSQNRPARFKASGIESLTGEHIQYDLAESIGPDLLLSGG